MQRLYAQLTRPLPASTGDALYCLMIVDDVTNICCPVFLPADKIAANVILVFCHFQEDVMAYGQSKCLRKDNAFEFTNTEFHMSMVDHNIRREFKSVDGPKRNDRVERKLAPVADCYHVVVMEFQTMFDDVELAAM